MWNDKGDIWEVSTPSSQFYCKLKSALKNEILKTKKPKTQSLC